MSVYIYIIHIYVCMCVYIYMGFPCGSADKESACNAGDLGLIPGLGNSPGKGKGYPLVFWSGEFHGLYSQWSC